MSSPAVRRARTETNGSIRTRSELVLKSRIACDPKPGINRGDTSANPTAAAATRLAPRPALGSNRAAFPGPVHTGPQPCTRRSPSAKITARAAIRKATP